MLFALTTKESSKIADFLELFIKFYGVPKIIQADNGREFKGAVAIFCKRLKIKVINGSLAILRLKALWSKPMELQNGRLMLR